MVELLSYDAALARLQSYGTIDTEDLRSWLLVRKGLELDRLSAYRHVVEACGCVQDAETSVGRAPSELRGALFC